METILRIVVSLGVHTREAYLTEGVSDHHSDAAGGLADPADRLGADFRGAPRR